MNSKHFLPPSSISERRIDACQHMDMILAVFSIVYFSFIYYWEQVQVLLIRIHFSYYFYRFKNQMDHSSQEFIDIFFTKTYSKEPKELAQFIQHSFNNPNLLIEKMESLKTGGEIKSESGLDVQTIFKIYENIGHCGQELVLSSIYRKSLDVLNLLPDLKSFLKSAREMKYFLILTLWKQLFQDPSNYLLLKLLQAINKASYYNQIFVGWLQDLPADYLKFVTHQLIKLVEGECKKLVQKKQNPQVDTDVLARNTNLACNYLKLLFESNTKKHRIPLTQFNSSFLINFFEPVEVYKIYLNKLPNFNFVNYSFLLSFDYKYKLIQIESIYEQKMSIRKNMENGLSSIIQNIDFNHGIEGLIFLYFTVNRNNLLDESMEKLGKIKQNLKSPLKIQFIGEEGADEGGVKNEYFSLITKAIFNPYLDMFLPKNNGRFYWFNGFSYEIPLRFEFVGMLLGLSLYNSVHLDLHFPQIIYKKLLKKNYEEDYGIEIVEDLRQIEPDVYRTLKDILTTTEDVEQIELYFNIQLESFGQKFVENLVEDGSQIKVSNDNREYYCLLYADYILNKHIAKQFAPFRKGFYKVVSGGIIQTFEAEELRILTSGTEDINMQELQESASYEGGYTAETPVIRQLWQFLHSLVHEDKKNFLTFVTGTDRVPIDGLKSLKFLIQRHSNTNNLPTAHTCFNVLLLPQYENRQILEKNLKLILEHNQGFGLI